MRTKLALFLGLIILTSPLFANDRWILISGTVSNFHTDARLFNPSFTNDIQVTATFYSTSGGTPLTATVSVPKRQMKVLDDVTSQLFSTTNLGAILFSSNDEFEVTSRIYALTPAGTLGQFGPGNAPSIAKTSGAVLQLKQNGANGQSGTFRTNIGLVNPNNATANVKWALYDKNNAVVATKTVTYPAFTATAPTLLTSIVGVTSGDFSDAWISYTSDQPVLVYGSVIDNGTTDQTFIPAVDDKGVAPSTPPPPPPTTSQSFDVSLRNFSISISPTPATLKVGDQVVMHVKVIQGPHGFQLVGPNGDILVPGIEPTPGGSAVDVSFTVTSAGRYTYFCTNSGCGSGHTAMVGSFTVNDANPPDRGY